MTDAAERRMLTCRGLAVRRGRRVVLRDVDLEIASDECVTLIGPNGSGKTSLMLALLGLLKPAAGGVLLDGKSMSALSARARGRFAAYVPQVIERVPGFTVFDVTAGGRFPHTHALQPLAGEDLDAVDEALNLTGMTALADRPVNAISGGERQKAMIAAAIAQDARVMFLDEPNTALDPGYQVELVRILREQHARGRGLVIISHDLHLPLALGGRVIALRDGRVVDDDVADALLTPERLAGIYDAAFDVAVTAAGRRVITPRW